MTKAKDRTVDVVEAAQGGKGILRRDSLLNDYEKDKYCNLFAKITLEKDAVLGYHEHHGETETYYILSGTGIYSDDGKEVEVEAGDVVFCDDGHGHGLTNTGDGELSFMALIMKK